MSHLKATMTSIVRVVAHTSFVGMPVDLLPIEKAQKQQDALWAQAQMLVPQNIGNIRFTAAQRDTYLSDDVVRAEAYRLVMKAEQDQGTDIERLIECAGRACYDSYGNGRASGAYHQHILDVNHGSVMEHASISFFLGNISRGCTHELVRHRVGVAISQRSTRYVDESTSNWIHHPLVEAYEKAWLAGDVDKTTAPDDLIGNMAFRTETLAQETYRTVVSRLEAWLISRGTDKFTARKQARGAARGYLGNALCTEMIWTCNVRALRGIIDQRVKAAADAEIRILFGAIYEAAKPYFPAYLNYEKRSCPDGLGFELFDPNSAVEKLKVVEGELEMLRTFRAAHLGGLR